MLCVHVSKQAFKTQHAQRMLLLRICEEPYLIMIDHQVSTIKEVLYQLGSSNWIFISQQVRLVQPVVI